jgi:hypothetical protein
MLKKIDPILGIKKIMYASTEKLSKLTLQNARKNNLCAGCSIYILSGSFKEVPRESRDLTNRQPQHLRNLLYLDGSENGH